MIILNINDVASRGKQEYLLFQLFQQIHNYHFPYALLHCLCGQPFFLLLQDPVFARSIFQVHWCNYHFYFHTSVHDHHDTAHQIQCKRVQYHHMHPGYWAVLCVPNWGQCARHLIRQMRNFVLTIISSLIYAQISQDVQVDLAHVNQLWFVLLLQCSGITYLFTRILIFVKRHHIGKISTRIPTLCYILLGASCRNSNYESVF